jgi:hypothetical protein
MNASVTRLFRQAVRYATATVKDIAEESDRARVTFDKYLNERPPSMEAARALANALENRGRMLLQYAERLREAAGDEPGRSARRVAKKAHRS